MVLRLLRAKGPRASTPRPPDAEAIDPLRTLVSAARSGDRHAERTLLVTLGPALLRAVRGVLGAAHPDVEDALQESMAAVHAALASFRGECKTAHFASRVAVQSALNARRRAKYRAQHTPHASPEEIAELARDGRTPADARAAAERRNALRALLDELPEVQAQVLVLHVVLGHSVDETSRTMGTPRDTVRSRLRAALATLRARIRSDGALLEILERKP